MIYRPLLSVIIPCYNSEKFIERTINSLLAQRMGDNLQIIIADDDSTTPFFYLVQNDFKNLKNSIYTRIPQHTNHCPGYTQAWAMKYVTGKYLVNLDHDDYIVPLALRNAVYQFDEKRKINPLYNRVITHPYYEKSDKQRYIKDFNFTLTHGKIYVTDFIRSCNIHFVPMRMYQDLQFNINYEVCSMCLGMRYIEIPDYFYVWTDEPSSLTHRNRNSHCKDYIYFFYNAIKIELLRYKAQFYFDQEDRERKVLLSFFLNLLKGLFTFGLKADELQRINYVKALFEDIAQIFTLEHSQLLELIPDEDVKNDIRDERKIKCITYKKSRSMS